LAIILVATVTAQEYTWRTVSLWLSHGLSRPTLMAAKFTSFLLPLLLIVVTASITGALGTGFITYSALGTLSLNHVALGRVGLKLVYTAYTLLPYASLTFLLVVVTRSVAAAVGVGIAYSLMVEGLAVQLLSAAGSGLAEVGKYLPGSLAQTLLLNPGLVEVSGPEGAAVNPPLLGVGLAAVLIAGYTIVFLGLATWAFHRQDITA